MRWTTVDEMNEMDFNTTNMEWWVRQRDNICNLYIFLASNL